MGMLCDLEIMCNVKVKNQTSIISKVGLIDGRRYVCLQYILLCVDFGFYHHYSILMMVGFRVNVFGLSILWFFCNIYIMSLSKYLFIKLVYKKIRNCLLESDKVLEEFW